MNSQEIEQLDTSVSRAEQAVGVSRGMSASLKSRGVHNELHVRRTPRDV